MPTILHFRDLKCWQKAGDLNDDLFHLTKDTKAYFLKDQLLRAALSIQNNIAEGFGRKSHKERMRFFEIATSSCCEVESMTYNLERLNLLTMKNC